MSNVEIHLRSTADTTGFQKTETAASKLGGFLKGAFIGALLSAGYAAIRFGNESAEAFQTFDNSMREIFTLMPEASAAVRVALSDDMRAVGKELGRLPEEMQSAVYQFISLGGDMGDSMDAVTLASNAARAGVADLTDTMSVGRSVFNAYNHMGYELEDIYDQFFFMIKNGAITMEGLNAVMSEVTDVSGELGIDLEDVSAALITMTKTGTDLDVAAQLLRLTMTQLGISGSIAGKAFEEAAGISFRKFIDQGGNLSQALRILKDHSDDTGVALGEMLGDSPFFRDAETMRGILQLTTVMMEEFEHQTAEAHNVLGASAEAAREFEGSMQLLDDQLQATKASAQTYLGEALEPLSGWWKGSQAGLYDHIEGLARLNIAYRDGEINLLQYYQAANKLQYTRAGSQDVMEDLAKARVEEERTARIAARAYRIYAQSVLAMGGAYAGNRAAMQAHTDQLRINAQAQAEAEAAYADMRLTAFEATKGIESYDKAHLNLTPTVQGTTAAVRKLDETSNTYEVTADQVAEADRRRTEAADAAAAATLAQEQAYGRALLGARSYIEETEEGIVSNWNFRDALFESLGAAGAQRDMLYEAAEATGNYSKEMLEAMLIQAGMAEAVDIVTAALRDGSIPTLADGIQALEDFEEALRKDYTLEFDFDSLANVKTETDGVMGRIREIAKTHHVNFVFGQTGNIPKLPENTGGAGPQAIPQAEGGDWLVTRPTLFLAGEAGPERATFTPLGGGNGRSGGEGLVINGPLVHVENVSDMATVDEIAMQTAEILRSYRR
jgi:TP901 family phage tail tape measure protein